MWSRTVTLLTIPVVVLAFAVSVYYLPPHLPSRGPFAVLLKADFVKLAALIALTHFACIVVRGVALACRARKNRSRFRNRKKFGGFLREAGFVYWLGSEHDLPAKSRTGPLPMQGRATPSPGCTRCDIGVL